MDSINLESNQLTSVMSSNDINEKDNFINDFILNEKKLETVKMTDRSM